MFIMNSFCIPNKRTSFLDFDDVLHKIDYRFDVFAINVLSRVISVTFAF